MEIENREITELSPIEHIASAAKKRKKDAPSPIALEPCSGNRAAVLSLLVRLPTGKYLWYNYMWGKSIIDERDLLSRWPFIHSTGTGNGTGGG